MKMPPIAALLLSVSCVVTEDSTGGTKSATHVDTLFCEEASDCPADPDCATWWCQQLRLEDEDYGEAWGWCNLAPLVGGALCDGGAGICIDKKCRPAGM